MASVKQRLFGAPLHPFVHEKLSARQHLAAGYDDVFKPQVDDLSHLKREEFGKFENLNFDENHNFVSSRTPFARMWTGIQAKKQTPVNDTKYRTFDDCFKGENAENETEKGRFIRRNKDDTYQYYEFSDVDHPQFYVVGDANFNQFMTSGPNQSKFGGSDIVSRHKVFPEPLTSDNNQYFNPAAGLVDISVATTDMGDTLALARTVEINFTVHNFEDYDQIYSRWFLRPGAQIWVDYGWDNALESLYDPNKLMQEAKEGAESLEELVYGESGIVASAKGDMEVILGVVTSYDAKVREDGGMDCTIELITRNAELIEKRYDRQNNKQRYRMVNGLEIEVMRALMLGFDGGKSVADASRFWYSDEETQNDWFKYFHHFAASNFSDSATSNNIWKNDITTWKGQNNRQMTTVNLSNSNQTSQKTVGGLPSGECLKHGVYYDVKSDDIHSRWFVSWGFFEDKILNYEFGFGESSEWVDNGLGKKVLKRKDSDNLVPRFNSQNSFVRFDKDLVKAQIHKPHNKAKWLYPGLANYHPTKGIFTYKSFKKAKDAGDPFMVDLHSSGSDQTMYDSEATVDVTSASDNPGSLADEQFEVAEWGVYKTYNEERGTTPLYDMEEIIGALDQAAEAWTSGEHTAIGYTMHDFEKGADIFVPNGIFQPGTPKWDEYEKNSGMDDGEASFFIQAYDRYKMQRCPLRELFINLSVIKEAIAKNNTVDEMIHHILNTINKDSHALFNLKISSTGTANNEIAFVDNNYVHSLHGRQAGDWFDSLFTFKPFSPSSICKSLEVTYDTPKDVLADIITIQTMAGSMGGIFAANEVLDRWLAAESVEKGGMLLEDEDLQNYGMTYLPEQGDYRAKRLKEDQSANTYWENWGQEDLMYGYDAEGKTKAPINKPQNYDDVLSKAKASGDRLTWSDLGEDFKQFDEEKKKQQSEPGTETTVEKDEKSAASTSKKAQLIEIETGMKVVSSVYEFYEYQAKRKFYLDVIATLMPIKLELSVAGIALIQPGDLIKVDYLPLKYRNMVFFQILSVSHKISPEGWETSFETGMRMTNQVKRDSGLYSEIAQVMLSEKVLEEKYKALPTHWILEGIIAGRGGTDQYYTSGTTHESKDYSDYFMKAIGKDAFRRIQVANVDLPAGAEIVLKMEARKDMFLPMNAGWMNPTEPMDGEGFKNAMNWRHALEYSRSWQFFRGTMTKEEAVTAYEERFKVPDWSEAPVQAAIDYGVQTILTSIPALAHIYSNCRMIIGQDLYDRIYNDDLIRKWVDEYLQAFDRSTLSTKEPAQLFNTFGNTQSWFFGYYQMGVAEAYLSYGYGEHYEDQAWFDASKDLNPIPNFHARSFGLLSMGAPEAGAYEVKDLRNKGWNFGDLEWFEEKHEEYGADPSKNSLGRSSILPVKKGEIVYFYKAKNKGIGFSDQADDVQLFFKENRKMSELIPFNPQVIVNKLTELFVWNQAAHKNNWNTAFSSAGGNTYSLTGGQGSVFNQNEGCMDQRFVVTKTENPPHRNGTFDPKATVSNQTMCKATGCMDSSYMQYCSICTEHDETMCVDPIVIGCNPFYNEATVEFQVPEGLEWMMINPTYFDEDNSGNYYFEGREVTYFSDEVDAATVYDKRFDTHRRGWSVLSCDDPHYDNYPESRKCDLCNDPEALADKIIWTMSDFKENQYWGPDISDPCFGYAIGEQLAQMNHYGDTVGTTPWDDNRFKTIIDEVTWVNELDLSPYGADLGNFETDPYQRDILSGYRDMEGQTDTRWNIYSRYGMCAFKGCMNPLSFNYDARVLVPYSAEELGLDAYGTTYQFSPNEGPNTDKLEHTMIMIPHTSNPLYDPEGDDLHGINNDIYTYHMESADLGVVSYAKFGRSGGGVGCQNDYGKYHGWTKTNVLSGTVERDGRKWQALDFLDGTTSDGTNIDGCPEWGDAWAASEMWGAATQLGPSPGPPGDDIWDSGDDYQGCKSYSWSDYTSANCQHYGPGSNSPNTKPRMAISGQESCVSNVGEGSSLNPIVNDEDQHHNYLFWCWKCDPPKFYNLSHNDNLRDGWEIVFAAKEMWNAMDGPNTNEAKLAYWAARIGRNDWSRYGMSKILREHFWYNFLKGAPPYYQSNTLAHRISEEFSWNECYEYIMCHLHKDQLCDRPFCGNYRNSLNEAPDENGADIGNYLDWVHTFNADYFDDNDIHFWSWMNAGELEHGNSRGELNRLAGYDCMEVGDGSDEECKWFGRYKVEEYGELNYNNDIHRSLGPEGRVPIRKGEWSCIKPGEVNPCGAYHPGSKFIDHLWWTDWINPDDSGLSHLGGAPR